MRYYTCPVNGEWITTRRCPVHQPERGNFRERGYGPEFERNRKALLRRHPRCAICGGKANTADHHPLTRRQRVARGLEPDALDGLRALCSRCHSTHTANDPRTRGGWYA